MFDRRRSMTTTVYYEAYPTGGKTDYWLADAFEDAFPNIVMTDNEWEELTLGNITIDDILNDEND